MSDFKRTPTQVESSSGKLILIASGTLLVALVGYIVFMGDRPFSPLEIRLAGILIFLSWGVFIFSQFIKFNATVNNTRYLILLKQEITKLNSELAKHARSLQNVTSKVNTKHLDVNALLTEINSFIANLKRTQ